VNIFQQALYDNSSIIPLTGCWMWVGSLTGCHGKLNYSQLGFMGRKIATHRASYELFVGRIPEGMEVDHLCRHPWCINPAHLEAVTPMENWRRSSNPAAVNNRRPTCIRGHEYSGLDHKGNRKCAVCRRADMLRHRAKLAAKEPVA
jgi:hypothetical protein